MDKRGGWYRQYVFIFLFIFLVSSLFIPFTLATDPYKSILHSAEVPQAPKLKLAGVYQTDIFTGAATYSYPLEVPPGTNKLQPSLSLSYNSQTMKQKSGTAGAGWLMSESYISRDTNFTLDNASDDGFTLVLEGHSYPLAYSPTSGRYHTRVETFQRIQNLSSGANAYWLVTAKDGTQYRFGYTGDSELSSNTGRGYSLKWYLDQTEDTHNNTIFYTYQQNPFTGDNGTVYLSTIVYNDDQRRQINFTYGQDPGAREVFEEGNDVNITSRVRAINAYANNSLVRVYQFAYAPLNNESTLYSLSNITYLGDNNATVNHRVKFGYSAPTTGYSRNDSNNGPLWFPPVLFSDTVTSDLGVRLQDLNNDGYVDLVKGDGYGPAPSQVWLNNRSSGWGQNVSIFEMPRPFTDGSTDQGLRFAELNGDGFIDLLHSVETDVRRAWLNNGTGFENATSWAPPQNIFFVNGSYADQGVQVVDLNGDGRDDLIRAYTNPNPPNEPLRAVYLNNGSGWENTSQFWPPILFTRGDGRDWAVRFVDFNGDGLVDMLQSGQDGTSIYKGAWLNTGDTWLNISGTAWDPPIYFVDTGLTNERGVRFADVNADGLTDILQDLTNTTGGSENKVWLNTGQGWKSADSWDSPENFIHNDYNAGRRIADVNGDGFPDIVVAANESTKYLYTWVHNTTNQHVLANITHEFGGVTSLTYVDSTDYNHTGNDSKSDLGFNMLVLLSAQQDNAMTGTAKVVALTNYSYTDGFYDGQRREFRGFGEVNETLSDKTLINHFFHQDDAKKGKEYRTTTYNSSGNIFQLEEKQWTNTSQDTYFTVFLTGTKEKRHDGVQSGGRQKRTVYSYDSYGNVITVRQDGEQSVSGDEKYEYYAFVYNTTAWIVDRMQRSALYAVDNATKKKETLFYYDNLAYGSSPTKGELTTQQEWIKPGANATTNYTYDTYGNVIVKTDANGKNTTYTFDVVTNTFAEQVTNAKGFSYNYSYDLGTGNLLSERETNGFITNYGYDHVGRLRKVVRPFDNSTYPSINYNYSLDGTAPEQINVSNREMNLTANTLDAYYFYDGFGNIVQVKSEAEGSQQTVQDIYYDANWRVASKSNPYFVSFGPGYTTPSAVARTNFTYDALGRVLEVLNPDSSKKRLVFDHWNETVYDENNNYVTRTRDAYDRILRVYENNGTTNHTTTYTYDAADNLVKITDSIGKNFSFGFDTVGRKINMSDPDLGNWTYAYDGVGNMLNQTDARMRNTYFTYDGINRVTNESSTNESILYTYDAGLNMTLAMVQKGELKINYTYDNRLRKVNERKEIGTAALFTRQFTYDGMDRVKDIIIPAKETISYTYTTQGLIDTVGSVVTHTLYTAFNLPANRTYGNSLVTVNTYNATTLRIQKIETAGKQNMTYGYDATGNMILINDTQNSLQLGMTYDKLNRLFSANRTNRSTSSGDAYQINYTYDNVGNILRILYSKYNITFNYSNYPSPIHAPKGAIVEDGTNSLPTQGNPIINSSSGKNVTRDNVTIYNQSTADADNDAVKNIYNWYENNVSFSIVSLPFEGGSNATFTKDYSSLNNDGAVNGPTWNSSGGYDGWGAYNFSGGAANNISLRNSSASNITKNQLTLVAWIKVQGNTTRQIIARAAGENTTQRQYGLYVTNTGALGFETRTSFGGVDTSRGSISNNVWTHVAGVYDGSNMIFYINGVQAGTSAPQAGNIVPQITNTTLGEFPGGLSKFSGVIDEVMILDRALSAQQILLIYQNQTNRIHSSTTTIRTTWTGEIYPNDGKGDGTALNASLTIINSQPTQGNSIINSSSGLNVTTDNITIYNQSTLDANDEPVKNIYNWFVNDIPFYSAYLPFEGGSNSTFTKDYSGGDHSGDVNGLIWNPTGGYDGYGAYEFSGAGNNITLRESPSHASLNITGNQLTLTAWIKVQGNTARQIIARAAGENTTQRQYGLYLTNTGALGFETRTSSGTIDTSRGSISNNVWTHVAGVYDGNNMIFYINGVQVGANASQTGNIVSQIANVTLGEFPGGVSRFSGTLDEVMILNRSLSAQQIFLIYQNKTHVIHSSMTTAGETWKGQIYPNDGSEDGTALNASLAVV